jgi:two-component system NtrC family response regulator
VRELENVIERAMVLCPGDILKVDDLPRDFRNSISDSQRLDGIPEDAPLFETLLDIEKKMILRALKITGNVQSDAANLLGIGKSGLNKKLKKHGISFHLETDGFPNGN